MRMTSSVEVIIHAVSPLSGVGGVPASASGAKETANRPSAEAIRRKALPDELDWARVGNFTKVPFFTD
jgi:hypothetical protein